MSIKSCFLATLITSVAAIATSVICSEVAMSDPVLIIPSQRYQEHDYIINGGGDAYDFCIDETTFGYIVVSAETANRLESRYPVRSTCASPTSSNFRSLTSSTTFQNTEYSPYSYSNSRSDQCKVGIYYTRVVKGKTQRVRCPRR